MNGCHTHWGSQEEVSTRKIYIYILISFSVERRPGDPTLSRWVRFPPAAMYLSQGRSINGRRVPRSSSSLTLPSGFFILQSVCFSKEYSDFRQHRVKNNLLVIQLFAAFVLGKRGHFFAVVFFTSDPELSANRKKCNNTLDSAIFGS